MYTCIHVTWTSLNVFKCMEWASSQKQNYCIETMLHLQELSQNRAPRKSHELLCSPQAVSCLSACVCVCFRPLIRFVAVALHCDLTRISLMINYVARFFTCLSTIHISLLKRLFRPFARLLIGLLVFLLGLAVLHIYSTNKSLSYMFCKYCLPVCGWYFYSLNSVCCRAEKF